MDSEQSLKVNLFSHKYNKSLVSKYYQGHIDALNFLKLKDLFHSSNNKWLNNEEYYGVIITNQDESIVYGGARVQCHKDHNNLPIFDLLGRDDLELNKYINSLKDFKYGEIVGIWKNPKFKFNGLIPKIITRSFASITKEVPLDYLFGLSVYKIFPVLEMLGGRKIIDVGENGYYYYTKNKIPASIYYFTLENLNLIEIPEEKQIIDNLLLSPISTINETIRNQTYKVSYNFSFK